MTTIAPVADQASATPPDARGFDRAALVVFGTMVALILLLTAVLLQTSFPASATTAADQAADLPATVAAQMHIGR